MRLVETVPGENGVVCVFESSAGEKFSVTWPAMSEEEEARVVERLREVLGEEGGSITVARSTRQGWITNQQEIKQDHLIKEAECTG